MAVQIETIPAGKQVVRQGYVCYRALVLQSGMVRLTRQVDDLQVPIAYLGPGDVVSAECLFEDSPLNYSAETIKESSAYTIQKDDFQSAVSEGPEWLRGFIDHAIRRTRVGDRPVRSSLSTLYGIGSLLLKFLQLRRTDEESVIHAQLTPVLDELHNILPLSQHFIHPVLVGLSDVGLINLKVSDPYTQIIEVPSEGLMEGFLRFARSAADMQSDMTSVSSGLPTLTLSQQASDILDYLITLPEYSERIFNPSRSMVHLDFDAIGIEISESIASGKRTVSSKVLAELEEYRVLRRIRDSGKLTLFLDLRAMLRLNVLRDPTSNFVDIIDHLLTRMFYSRFEDHVEDVSIRS